MRVIDIQVDAREFDRILGSGTTPNAEVHPSARMIVPPGVNPASGCFITLPQNTRADPDDILCVHRTQLNILFDPNDVLGFTIQPMPDGILVYRTVTWAPSDDAAGAMRLLLGCVAVWAVPCLTPPKEEEPQSDPSWLEDKGSGLSISKKDGTLVLQHYGRDRRRYTRYIPLTELREYIREEEE